MKSGHFQVFNSNKTTHVHGIETYRRKTELEKDKFVLDILT